MAWILGPEGVRGGAGDEAVGGREGSVVLQVEEGEEGLRQAHEVGGWVDGWVGRGGQVLWFLSQASRGNIMSRRIGKVGLHPADPSEQLECFGFPLVWFGLIQSWVGHVPSNGNAGGCEIALAVKT